MTERPSQTYACQSKGCANGFGSAFQAAPEDWFTERGFTPPKNCPQCRDWVKSQVDEAVNCSSCRRSRLIPAKYKISHHKRTGPWETPEKCKRCEVGKPPRQSRVPRPPREKSLELDEEDAETFDQIADGIHVEARQIETDLQAYEDLRPDGDSHRTHIERHVTDSPHSLVGNGKTATAFANGPDSFPGFIQTASVVMQITDPMRTREFLEARGKGRQIVRLTLLADDQHIEKTVIDEASTRVVTSHDEKTVRWALNKYGRKQK